MENDTEIVFRRIRGRIVPIKRKKGGLSKKDKKGLGLLGGGVGTGVAGGISAAKLIDRGNKLQKVSKFQGNKAKFIRKQAMTAQMLLGDDKAARNKRFAASFNLSKKAARTSKIARGFRFGGIGLGVGTAIASSSLIEAGITPFANKFVGKENDADTRVKREFIQNTVSGGVALGITLLAGRTPGAKKIARIIKKRRK